MAFVQTALRVFSPAKINLFLAVTGRRADGFHTLVSLVAPVAWGDTLTITPAEHGGIELTTDEPTLAVDGSNLVLRAAAAFREATGWRGGARIALAKRIPMGAGLGGGSSNAAATLRALDRLAGTRLGAEGLRPLAAAVGSDCPLFLQDGPVVMRGRGEEVEPLEAADPARRRVGGRRVLLFKPAFPIATAWAYRRLAAMGPGVYAEEAAAERRWAAWRAGEARLEALLENTLERPVFEKYLALPVLLQRLRDEFGLEPRMSGSGSACFALLQEDTDVGPVTARVREAWGPATWVVDARLSP